MSPSKRKPNIRNRSFWWCWLTVWAVCSCWLCIFTNFLYLPLLVADSAPSVSFEPTKVFSMVFPFAAGERWKLLTTFTLAAVPQASSLSYHQHVFSIVGLSLWSVLLGHLLYSFILRDRPRLVARRSFTNPITVIVEQSLFSLERRFLIQTSQEDGLGLIHHALIIQFFSKWSYCVTTFKSRSANSLMGSVSDRCVLHSDNFKLSVHV